MPSETQQSAVDRGELWSIESETHTSEVYTLYGKACPFGSSAVAKAKKQYAEDRDVNFRHVVGKKIDEKSWRGSKAVTVVVVHNPPGALNGGVLP